MEDGGGNSIQLWHCQSSGDELKLRLLIPSEFLIAKVRPGSSQGFHLPMWELTLPTLEHWLRSKLTGIVSWYGVYHLMLSETFKMLQKKSVPWSNVLWESAMKGVIKRKYFWETKVVCCLSTQKLMSGLTWLLILGLNSYPERWYGKESYCLLQEQAWKSTKHDATQFTLVE